MKRKVRPFIMEHPLFYFYSCLYVFNFRLFSNISKTVLGPSHIRFCTEFQMLSFDNKKSFNHKDNRGEILKILRAQFFMGHPLSYLFFFYILVITYSSCPNNANSCQWKMYCIWHLFNYFCNSSYCFISIHHIGYIWLFNLS